MRIVQGMGLFTGVLLLSAVMSAGCSSVAPPDEELNQGSLDQPISAAPSAPSDGKCNDPAPDACSVHPIGNGKKCLDPAKIKDKAFKGCDEDGLVLTDLTITKTCASGLPSKASYTCCPKPPPDPGPVGCIVGDLGDGQTCQDPGTFKTNAFQLCDKDGLVLTDLKLSSDCAGGLSTKASYVCCGGSSPKPPPQTCSGGQLGDGQTCQADSAFLTQAEDVCAQAGLDFAGVKTINDCPGGLSTYGFYTCCAPAQP